MFRKVGVAKFLGHSLNAPDLSIPVVEGVAKVRFKCQGVSITGLNKTTVKYVYNSVGQIFSIHGALKFFLNFRGAPQIFLFEYDFLLNQEYLWRIS